MAMLRNEIASDAVVEEPLVSQPRGPEPGPQLAIIVEQVMAHSRHKTDNVAAAYVQKLDRRASRAVRLRD